LVEIEHTFEIVAAGRSLEEALQTALGQVIDSTVMPPSDSDTSLAIPLRARDPDETSLVNAMLTELLQEIADGARIASAQIDGLLKRDGDFVCWGYAFAASEINPALGSVFLLEQVTVLEEQGSTVIRVTLARQGN